MDAVKFIKERARMCDSLFGCEGCPANSQENGLGECFVGIKSKYAPEQQIEIVDKWSKEHPRKTRQSVFLEQYPVRKATVVYVHPKGRYIVAECKGVRETFFPEDVIQCDLPGPPPMEYDLKTALFTLTEEDKKIMAALGRKF